MSHLTWPQSVEFSDLRLEPDERDCGFCGRMTYINAHKHRYVHTLEGPVHVISRTACCRDPSCPGHATKQRSSLEMTIAPPFWTVGWDMFAWMGHRRFARHWSVPQIRAELADRYGVRVSDDLIEDYTAKYEVMVAARESDVAHLAKVYREVPDVMLSIDGLQPEKGHETLYVVRELRAQRVWFAEPLLSSAAGEVRRLFERARDLAAVLDKPVRCWVSDKQDAFVTGVAEVFAGVPHRYCANHFLRDAAKPMLEADSHAKVQMRRKVRGLRDIERRMLAQNEAPVPAAEAAFASPVGQSEQVVLDYCAAVRGILNDDQGGPLHPPGVRMAEALGEVHDSIGRARAEKKGGSASDP